MHRRSLLRAGAVALTAALALTACGNRDNGGTTGGTPGTGAATGAATKTVKIGVVAPLTGDLSALGLGIKNSVELAVQEANRDGKVPGWKIQVVPKDDQGQTDPAKNAATQLAADPDVIGVVGTLNSSTAQVVQPVLAPKSIAMISPANTNPGLTQGAKWKDSPKRPYPIYFRTCTTDAVQGPFAARYLFNKAGIKQVATVHDKKTYGQGLVETFTEEFKKLGGTITSAQTINPDDANYNAVISAIKPTSPKAVYYGGEYPQAGPLSQQMKAAGLNIPLMGGDGIYSGDYLKLAGKTGSGDLATSVGAPTEKLPTAQKFVAAYKAAKFKDPYEAYGAYAYDAANALINGMAAAMKDAKDVSSARKPVVEAVGKVSFDGVTGKVGFDQYGDTTSKILTVYKVTNAKWADVNTEEFK